MELRACYFCGSPAGLDTYPVVPERVAATPAGEDPGRDVLCPDCRAKLEHVLDGVLGASVEGGDAVDTVPQPPDDGGFSAEITFGDDAADDPRVEGGGDASDADEGTDTDRDAGVDVDHDPPTAPGEEDGSGALDVPAGLDEPTTPAEASAGDEGDDADGAAGSSGELRGLGDSGAGQYRQALRLLQNREFPMSRSDLVEVMASAYDLSRDECDRLVDFAVDRGWLTDDGGVLRRD